MTLHAGPMTSDRGHLVAAALVRQRDRCLPNRKSRNYSRSHKSAPKLFTRRSRQFALLPNLTFVLATALNVHTALSPNLLGGC